MSAAHADGSAPVPGTAPRGGPGTAQGAVRHVIVFGLLLALIVVTAIGLSGLLERLLDDLLPGGTPLVSRDTSGLARSLAFTLIGGPLAAGFWWLIWRRLDTVAERRSLAWGLYVAALCTIALIAAATALLSAAASEVGGTTDLGLWATGLVWAGVWVWHRYMLHDTVRGPLRLPTVGPVLGSAFGLVIFVGGAVTAVGSVFDTALHALGARAIGGDPWWIVAGQGLVWAVGGALIWVWHWQHDGTRTGRTAFGGVVLVLSGILGAGALTLTGAGVTGFALLRLLTDRADGLPTVLDLLGPALAAAGIGAAVWSYHRTTTLHRPAATRQAATFLTSGLGLAAAASGLGVIVNALLASMTSPLAGSDSRTLLLAGLSALLVGGPVWWVAWRPLARPQPQDQATAGRRVYLIAVFGLSAVVALITLLVLAFRIFEMFLDPVTVSAFVERIRAALGLLLATGLVAGYHFGVWRQERAEPSDSEQARHGIVSRVYLIAEAPATELIALIERVTGARVTLWQRAFATPSGRESGATTPSADTALAPDTEELLVSDLHDVTARRIVLIAGPEARLQVLPLAD